MRKIWLSKKLSICAHSAEVCGLTYFYAFKLDCKLVQGHCLVLIGGCFLEIAR